MYFFFLIIILIIFICLNIFLNNKYIKEYFDADFTKDDIDNQINNQWLNFCDEKPNNSYLYNPKFKAIHNNTSQENQIVHKCGNENEKCWVDTKGQNTCCGNLSCVRLKNNFGYKVCSYQKDACGYFRNDYLKYIFDDEWWNKMFDKIKKAFETKYQYNLVEEEEGESILQNKRKEILNYIRIKGLCGEKYSLQDIRRELDDFFQKDQIFSGLIYGVKDVYNNTISSDSKSDTDNDCRKTNSTLSLN